LIKPLSINHCSLVDPGVVCHWTGKEALHEGLTAHTGHIGPDAVHGGGETEEGHQAGHQGGHHLLSVKCRCHSVSRSQGPLILSHMIPDECFHNSVEREGRYRLVS